MLHLLLLLVSLSCTEDDLYMPSALMSYALGIIGNSDFKQATGILPFNH